MQEEPRIEKYPIAIQFLGTYVIVMGVSNLPAYGPLDVAYTSIDPSEVMTYAGL